VNITAIWKDSHTVGYISKNGNIYSCTKVESNKPEPTSMSVSNRFRIIKTGLTRKEIQKREPRITNNEVMKMITNITQDNFRAWNEVRQSLIWVNGTGTTAHGPGFLIHFLRKKK